MSALEAWGLEWRLLGDGGCSAAAGERTSFCGCEVTKPVALDSELRLETGLEAFTYMSALAPWGVAAPLSGDGG